jgi:ABC-type multidrug transport system ATPase subunit
VLCDRVAILKQGKLSQVGHLDELRQRDVGSNQVEVLATGIDSDDLRRHLTSGSKNAKLSATTNGVRVELADEKEVDEVLVAVRKAGGKLVSVQPLRQSLEELFLETK